MRFLYSNAPAGSGKTYSAINVAIENAKAGYHTVIAMPTLMLINEITSRHDGLGKCSLKVLDPDPDVISVQIITSETVGQNRLVSDVLRDEILRCRFGIIFTTHAALLGNPDLPNRDKWNLIVDEAFDVFEIKNLAVNVTYDEVMKGLANIDWPHSDSWEIVVDPTMPAFVRQERIEKSDTDELFKVLLPFYEAVCDKHVNVLMGKASFNDMNFKPFKALDLAFMRNPSILAGWLRVTMMAANFQYSYLYRYWSKLGVEFVQDEQITLQFALHRFFQGSRLTVNYLLEDPASIWTKGLIRSIGFQQITQRLERHIETKFIFTKNNNRPENKEFYDWEPALGQSLPVKAQGLNEYQNFTCAVFLAALNYDDKSLSVIAHTTGLSKAEINQANAHETVYQFIMRTNMRDSESDTPVEVIVGDKATADYLTSILEGAKSEWLDIGLRAFAKSEDKDSIERISQAQTGSDRTLASRAKAKEYKTRLESLEELVVGITEFDSVKSKTGTFSEIGNLDNLHEMLATFYEMNVSGKKEENILFNGALYREIEGSMVGRSEKDFLGIGIMQLDFDNTDLDPARCSQLLSEYEHWIYNSSSSFNAGGSWRYRVLIPFSRVVDRAFYENLWDMFKQRFIAVGFDDKTKQLGLDRSKCNPVSLFYAPCVAAKGKAHSFFKRNDNPTKLVLNPMTMLDKFSLPEHSILRIAREDRRGALVKQMAEHLVRQPRKAPLGSLFDKYRDAWINAAQGSGGRTLFHITRMMIDDGIDRSEAQQWYGMHFASRPVKDQLQKHEANWLVLLRDL